MTEIPEIGIHNIEIRTTEIPDYDSILKLNIPRTPPVTLSIGSPIIELPGCVEYNSGNFGGRLSETAWDLNLAKRHV